MAVKTSWAAGDVLLAADLTDTFAAKAALAGATYTGTHNFSGATVVEPAGRILQVVYADYSTAVTVTSTTYTDTGLSATITPKSSSSKILVLVSQLANTYRSTNEAGSAMKLLRGSTVIFTPDTSDTSSMYMYFPGTTMAQIMTRITLNYFDSPATTSATTYKTQGRPYATGSGGTVIYQNASGYSNMILMEVSG